APRAPNAAELPQVVVQGSALMRQTQPNAKLEPRYIAPVPCRGDVRLTAGFDSRWKDASVVGVLLYGGDRRGDEVVLRAAHDRVGQDGQSEPSSGTTLGEIKRQKGTLSLQILRHGRVMRQDRIPADELVDGPLHLEARLEQGKLTFQVNQLKPVEFYTAFTPGSREPGEFGLIWPAVVGLRSVQGSSKALPANPSPLELGDSLFDEGRYD